MGWFPYICHQLLLFVVLGVSNSLLVTHARSPNGWMSQCCVWWIGNCFTMTVYCTSHSIENSFPFLKSLALHLLLGIWVLDFLLIMLCPYDKTPLLFSSSVPHYLPKRAIFTTSSTSPLPSSHSLLKRVVRTPDTATERIIERNSWNLHQLLEIFLLLLLVTWQSAFILRSTISLVIHLLSPSHLGALAFLLTLSSLSVWNTSPFCLTPRCLRDHHLVV